MSFDLFTSSVPHPWKGRGTHALFLLATHVLTALVLGVAGCQYHVDWPECATETTSDDTGGTCKAYAIDGAPKPNYFQDIKDGRVTALRFDRDAAGTSDETVQLLGEHPEWPHFLIILDGVPFDLVEAMYDEGHFRFFAPPARVVCPFPAMTDIALSRVFHTKRCVAAEALYFDRDTDAMSNGNDVYMRGENAPWITAVTYSAPQNVAVGTYLNPRSVFSRELRDMHRLFRETTELQASAYSVGSAGLGTRGGEAAIRAYLCEIEKLCERVTYDRAGRVRFTITADHGHGLQRCERVCFQSYLAEEGFRPRKSLSAPNDVVEISYGLVTYAQFHTNQPEKLANALARHEAVELAMFREGAAVMVLGGEQRAAIRRGDAGYSYEMLQGDPLGLAEIVASLKAAGHVDAAGNIADRALFEATSTHKYPDPLHRIWCSFDDLVEKPADVIVSLKPGKCHGSKFFHFFVAPVASTHGSLDYLSSVTFLLTNATPSVLPDIMRSGDVLNALGWGMIGSTASDDGDAHRE
ncbi:MAG: hypothetical protein ABII12_11030 [Planctomycetota bacterium]